MKEKRKEVTPGAPSGGGSIFDSVPELPKNTNLNVSSGPYVEDLPVAGTTVGEVRKKFSDRFDIDAQAVAIVNGVPVGEKYLLNAAESLMFVRHAGEKGGAHVVMEEAIARVFDGKQLTEYSMKVEDLCARVSPGMSTGPVILPAGIKCVLSQGNITLWIYEQPPRVHQLSWIAKDSPAHFGPGTKYRNVRIALPYLVIAGTFYRDGNGMPNLLQKDECFFRNEPLKSVEDELCFPALLNCSKWPDRNSMVHPLSWICTQYLKQTKQMASPKPEDRFQAGFEAVRYCLLETSFNLSSEHHEGNSWFSESKKIDPRIKTVEEWEKNTAKDPLFVLDVPWIKTGHSVAKLADRIFQQNGASAGAVKTADDLARIIINH